MKYKSVSAIAAIFCGALLASAISPAVSAQENADADRPQAEAKTHGCRNPVVSSGLTTGEKR